MKWVARTLLGLALLAITANFGRVFHGNRSQRPHIQATLPSQEYLGHLEQVRGLWREFYEPDSLLGYRLGRSKAVSHWGSLYVTTSQGFASIGKSDVVYLREKPKDVFRVVVLGGSTVFGDTALDPGQNLPAQILAALQAHFPKKDFEVINAGCNSYNSGHEALYLMSELVDFKPDLVIVYDGWNDMPVGVVDGGLRSAGRQNHIKSPEHYYFENRERASHSVWGAFKTLLDTVGDTIRVFAAKTWRDLTPVRPSPPADQERFSRGVPTEGASSQADLLRQLSNYREHLEIMLDLAVRHRFKIAFFLQPIMTVDGKRLTADENRILPYAHDATARKMYYLEARKMFQDLKRQASGSRLACVSDLSRVFAPVAASVYADTGHLLLHGEQIVAAEIVKRLDGCNLINE